MKLYILKFIIIIIIFIFSFGTGMLILHETEKNKTVGSLTNEICHFAIPKNDEYLNNKTLWQPLFIENWKQSNDLFFMYNTRNTLNFEIYKRSFINSNIEIWHHEEINGVDLYILRRKILKLVKNTEPCKKEPSFLFKTHLYCMITRLLNKTFKITNVQNFHEELSKTAIMFFLAQKYENSVRIRIIIDKNKFDKQNKYTIRIVRTKTKGTNHIADIFTNKLNKNNRQKVIDNFQNYKVYQNDLQITKIISKFNIKSCKCNLRFFIQEEENEVSVLEHLNNFIIQNINKYKTTESFSVLISENVIEKFVNLSFNQLYSGDMQLKPKLKLITDNIQMKNLTQNPLLLRKNDDEKSYMVEQKKLYDVQHIFVFKYNNDSQYSLKLTETTTTSIKIHH